MTPSIRFRRSVSALILLGALLPLSDLHAAPTRDHSARKPSTLQRLERQLSSLWVGVVNVWEKMGPRIDDNGFLGRAEDDQSPSSREDNFPPKPLF